ncbi:MAG: hypothetical protein VB104_11195 [Candidatus Limiplasma sp.]|nr:hypothetical protein [Candidatus Limiplasma sp.]
MACLRKALCLLTVVCVALGLLAAACGVTGAAARAEAMDVPASVAEARVLLVINNNNAMATHDPTLALPNAYRVLFALLPDGTRFAATTSVQDGPPPLQWQVRGPDDTQTSLNLVPVDLQTGKLNANRTNGKLKDAVAALSEADGGAPTDLVILNGLGVRLNTDNWKQAAAAMGPGGSFWLADYADNPQNQKENEDALKTLFGTTGDPVAEQKQTLNRSLLSGGEVGLSPTQAMDSVCACASRMFGLLCADAAPEADGAFTAAAVPTLGASDVRLLLENVPADRKLRVTGADGTVAEPEPIAVLTAAEGGTQTRVYTLSAPWLGAQARYALTSDAALEAAAENPEIQATDIPAEATEPSATEEPFTPQVVVTQSGSTEPSPTSMQTDVSGATASPEPAQAEPADAAASTQPQAVLEGAADPSAEENPAALRARFVFRFRPQIATTPVLLDAGHGRNAAHAVGVQFDSPQVGELLRLNAGVYQVFVRCIPEDLSAAPFDCIAQPDAGGAGFTAGINLPVSGRYTLRSGVRWSLGGIGECLNAQGTSATLDIINEKTITPDGAQTVELLLNPPPELVKVGVQEQTLDLRTLFTDADDPAETLHYQLSGVQPDAAAADTLDTARLHAKIQPGHLALHLRAATAALDTPSAQETILLTAIDPEGATATVRITVTLTDVTRALQATALRVAALDDPIPNADGRAMRKVTVLLGTGDAAGEAPSWPEALRQAVQERLQLHGTFIAGDASTAQADVVPLTHIGGWSWQGMLAVPFDKGSYQPAVEARLVMDDGSAGTWQADGWQAIDTRHPIQVENATPRLRADAAPTAQWLFLHEGEDGAPTRTYTLPGLYEEIPNRKLRYTLRVTDAQGQPVALHCLVDAQGAVAYAVAGGSQALAERRAQASGNALRQAEPASQDGWLTVADALTLEFCDAEAYTVSLRAVNIDSEPALYQEPVRVLRLLHLYLIAAALLLTVAATVAILARRRHRKRLKPYGAHTLLLTVEDPHLDTPLTATIPLRGWKIEPVTLQALLLNGAIPALCWLDPLAQQAALRPTVKGEPKLRLKGRARKRLLAEEGGRLRRHGLILKPDQPICLTADKQPNHQLTLTLQSPPVTPGVERGA